ncbi:MAG: DUF4276 family protein [Pseudomonadota bacterium]
MTRVYILVEGQTEETFVRELLAQHYARIGLYLTPILVSTSLHHKGGIVSYAKVKPQIERLCKQDGNAYVTTMFDLYALPGDFPGKRCAAWTQQQTGSDKANLIEAELSRDIDRRNFIPYIQVHEFEALLFVQPARFGDWTSTHVVSRLAAMAAANAPEDINDHPQSAPSKRILTHMPEYQKTFHGPLIACDIGLDAMRAACPHFASWLDKLDGLIR